MIKFKCKQCGQELMASDKEAGGRSKCPNCLSVQIVPQPMYVRMREKVRSERQAGTYRPPKLKSEESEEASNGEDSEYFGEDMVEDDSGFFDISFSEAGLFSMTFVFFLLLLAEGDMRRDLHAFVSRLCGGSGWTAGMGIAFVLVPFALGMGLSIFHAFSRRGKSYFERALMLFFAVAISGGTGIYMGWYILRGPGDLWLIIFGIWNLAYSGLMLLQFERIVLMEDDLDGAYIAERNATVGQIVLSVVAAVIILLCCEYWVKLHWVMTYSICITYTTGLDRQVQKLLVRR